MSQRSGPANGVDSYVQPYMDFWAGCFNRTAESARQMFENANGGPDPRALQQRWLEAMTQSIDAFLRSPVFLAAMKQNMDTAVKAKMQADDLTRELARNANVPTAADIAGLFERLRRVEDVILSRLADLESRFDAADAGESGDEGARPAISPRKRIGRKSRSQR
ncbi:MAG TPA: hypothetical protein VHY91_11405 [Pirellulales bacterium]|nr:hypothetical protein [Pirellulales bacterium]